MSDRRHLRRIVPALVCLAVTGALADDSAWIPDPMVPWLEGMEPLQSSRNRESLDRLLARQREHPGDVCGYFFPALVYLYYDLPRIDYEKRAQLGIELIDRGLDLAEDEDREDPASRYCTGGLYALRSSYRIRRGMNIRAAYDGKRFRRIMLDLREEYPHFVDCAFWSGIYEYYAAILPRYIKFFKTFMFLPSGKKELGFELMEEVARNGILNRHSAHWMLIDFHEREGDTGKTREAMLRLHERYPHDVSALLELAWDLATVDPEDLDRATALHVEALEGLESAEGFDVIPLVHRLRLSLAELYSRMRLDPQAAVDAALPAYEAARGEEKLEFDAAGSLVRDLNGSGRHEEAVAVLSAIEERYPASARLPDLRLEVETYDGPSSRIRLALLPALRLARDDKIEEARALFERLLEEHPGNPQIRAQMAEMYFEAAAPSLSRAEALFSRVVESAPEMPSFLLPYANMRLGNICDLTDRRREALAHYRRMRETAGVHDGFRKAAEHFLKNKFER